MQQNNSRKVVTAIAVLALTVIVGQLVVLALRYKDREVMEARATSFAAGCLTGVEGVMREDADELYKSWCIKNAVSHVRSKRE